MDILEHELGMVHAGIHFEDRSRSIAMHLNNGTWIKLYFRGTDGKLVDIINVRRDADQKAEVVAAKQLFKRRWPNASDDITVCFE